MFGNEAVQHLLDGFVTSVVDLLPVQAVWLHGSLALGDYQPGRSDLDLIVVLRGPIIDPEPVRSMHRSLERAHPLADKLHCSYLQADQLADATLRHPTWAHRRYFDRPVTPVTRRELTLGNCTLHGPRPIALLPPTTNEDLTAFIRHDLEHFWHPAARKRTRWLTDIWVDHGPIVVARADVTLRNGDLITKRAALDLLPSLGLSVSVAADIEHRRYATPAPGAPLWRLKRAHLARTFVQTHIHHLLTR
jgi:hypothetical protein